MNILVYTYLRVINALIYFIAWLFLYFFSTRSSETIHVSTRRDLEEDGKANICVSVLLQNGATFPIGNIASCSFKGVTFTAKSVTFLDVSIAFESGPEVHDHDKGRNEVHDHKDNCAGTDICHPLFRPILDVLVYVTLRIENLNVSISQASWACTSIDMQLATLLLTMMMTMRMTTQLEGRQIFEFLDRQMHNEINTHAMARIGGLMMKTASLSDPLLSVPSLQLLLHKHEQYGSSDPLTAKDGHSYGLRWELIVPHGMQLDGRCEAVSALRSIVGNAPKSHPNFSPSDNEANDGKKGCWGINGMQREHRHDLSSDLPLGLQQILAVVCGKDLASDDDPHEDYDDLRSKVISMYNDTLCRQQCALLVQIGGTGLYIRLAGDHSLCIHGSSGVHGDCASRAGSGRRSDRPLYFHLSKEGAECKSVCLQVTSQRHSWMIVSMIGLRLSGRCWSSVPLVGRWRVSIDRLLVRAAGGTSVDADDTHCKGVAMDNDTLSEQPCILVMKGYCLVLAACAPTPSYAVMDTLPRAAAATTVVLPLPGGRIQLICTRFAIYALTRVEWDTGILLHPDDFFPWLRAHRATAAATSPSGLGSDLGQDLGSEDTWLGELPLLASLRIHPNARDDASADARVPKEADCGKDVKVILGPVMLRLDAESQSRLVGCRLDAMFANIFTALSLKNAGQDTCIHIRCDTVLGSLVVHPLPSVQGNGEGTPPQSRLLHDWIIRLPSLYVCFRNVYRLKASVPNITLLLLPRSRVGTPLRALLSEESRPSIPTAITLAALQHVDLSISNHGRNSTIAGATAGGGRSIALCVAVAGVEIWSSPSVLHIIKNASPGSVQGQEQRPNSHLCHHHAISHHGLYRLTELGVSDFDLLNSNSSSDDTSSNGGRDRGDSDEYTRDALLCTEIPGIHRCRQHCLDGGMEKDFHRVTSISTDAGITGEFRSYTLEVSVGSAGIRIEQRLSSDGDDSSRIHALGLLLTGKLHCDALLDIFQPIPTPTLRASRTCTHRIGQWPSIETERLGRGSDCASTIMLTAVALVCGDAMMYHRCGAGAPAVPFLRSMSQTTERREVGCRSCREKMPCMDVRGAYLLGVSAEAIPMTLAITLPHISLGLDEPLLRLIGQLYTDVARVYKDDGDDGITLSEPRRRHDVKVSRHLHFRSLHISSIHVHISQPPDPERSLISARALCALSQLGLGQFNSLLHSVPLPSLSVTLVRVHLLSVSGAVVSDLITSAWSRDVQRRQLYGVTSLSPLRHFKPLVTAMQSGVAEASVRLRRFTGQMPAPSLAARPPQSHHEPEWQLQWWGETNGLSINSEHEHEHEHEEDRLPRCRRNGLVMAALRRVVLGLT